AESLAHFGSILDADTRSAWRRRLKRAMDFIYTDFTIGTGNINYPATATYALALAAELFGEARYLEQARHLAAQLLAYFTPHDRFLFGEGKPGHEPSQGGCYSVDLGYNVEESLPALLLYARMAGDQTMMDAVHASVRTHLEFLLPDGG